MVYISIKRSVAIVATADSAGPDCLKEVGCSLESEAALEHHKNGPSHELFARPKPREGMRCPHRSPWRKPRFT